jgi:hypothetical protein
MPLARYSKVTAEEALGRTIDRQWPGEALQVIAECHGDRGPTHRGEGRPFVRRDHLFVYDQDDAGEGGFVGATDVRLVLLERTTHASVLRAIGYVVGVLAVTILVGSQGLVLFLLFGGMAAAVLTVARAMEAVGIANSSVPFDRVFGIDRESLRIEGVALSGQPCCIRVRNPGDFEAILFRISPGSAASAA